MWFFIRETSVDTKPRRETMTRWLNKIEKGRIICIGIRFHLELVQSVFTR
jgi:hypothetical protein